MTIINAKIYTMEGAVIENGYIKIADGRFFEVGFMEKLGAVSDETIDAKGGYVLPGLIDAHSHIGLFEENIRFEGEDGNEDTDPITPQLLAIDGVNPMDQSFRRAVQAGVTTVSTGPGSANPIGGRAIIMKTYGKRIDNMAVKHIGALKIALGENPKLTYKDKDHMPVTRMAIAALIRESLTRAIEYRDKIRAKESVDFDIKNNALLDIINGNEEVHFHCHRADDIFTAIRITREFSLKPVLIHCTEGYLIADELSKEQIPVILGPIITTNSKPELSMQTVKNAAALINAGIKTAICTDCPEVSAEYLMLSVALAAKEGIGEMDAFATVTINAAEILGISNRVGSIKKGKDADLVIYSGHPFDIFSKVQAVMIGGKVVFNA